MTDENLPFDDVTAERDPATAELLAVPPLDEVTRRRLVSTAVAAADAAEPRQTAKRSRLALAIPVAAAIVLGLVIGTVVVSRPDDPTTAAGPAATTSPAAAQEDGAAAKSASPSPAAAAAPGFLVSLGDLGDVASTEQLSDAVISARESGRASETIDAATVPCGTTPAATLGLTEITAVGIGVDTSVQITVLVGTDADGHEVALALTRDACQPVVRADLG